jgi:hypothetical protein
MLTAAFIGGRWPYMPRAYAVLSTLTVEREPAIIVWMSERDGTPNPDNRADDYYVALPPQAAVLIACELLVEASGLFGDERAEEMVDLIAAILGKDWDNPAPEEEVDWVAVG